jgi:hypothetical protein
MSSPSLHSEFQLAFSVTELMAMYVCSSRISSLKGCRGSDLIMQRGWLGSASAQVCSGLLPIPLSTANFNGKPEKVPLPPPT